MNSREAVDLSGLLSDFCDFLTIWNLTSDIFSRKAPPKMFDKKHKNLICGNKNEILNKN